MKITEEIKISDNGFVFNSRTGDSFNLNPFGLELIKQIVEEKDFESIKDVMLEKYDVDDLTIEKDFYEFCALLKHHQIIAQGDPLDFK
ncbi:MAG: PqqD family peptide modification chaperone [Draconibacterium sp.]|nr:PqqD family peptide modification chaperone [Draconibacterium sp.]